MKKNPEVFLKHILESVEWIEKDTKDLSKADFFKNIPMQDAVIRRLEIIGEATRSLPDNFKKDNKNTPWQDIQDMRNKLIHEYFGVDLELVWSVVQNDLPPLKQQVEKLLSSLM